MKDTPLLFKPEMVRATLREIDPKEQTRRIVKPPRGWADKFPHVDPWCLGDPGAVWWWDGTHARVGVRHQCPYGKPGDRLWVRETGWETKEPSARELREGADTWAPYYYDADGWSWQDHEDFKAWGFKRRPSIFMPRWASRILLEITDIRVERLQDISEEDARAEGVLISDEWTGCADDLDGSYIKAYRFLWETINGAGSWDANPWVWVISFRRVES